MLEEEKDQEIEKKVREILNEPGYYPLKKIQAEKFKEGEKKRGEKKGKQRRE